MGFEHPIGGINRERDCYGQKFGEWFTGARTSLRSASIHRRAFQTRSLARRLLLNATDAQQGQESLSLRRSASASTPRQNVADYYR